MTKEELAAILNGREIGDEISVAEEKAAKDSGLVVVFGYSDDNCELRGAINDEISCFGGGDFCVNKTGVVMKPDEEETLVLEKFKVLDAAIGDGREIECLWCDGLTYSWTYKTAIPHAPFDIREGDALFCRGIVFSMSDV